MWKDFAQFLKEFKVVSLAIAFLMGTASTALINSFVKDILMPLLSPIMNTKSWKEAFLTLGPIKLGYGSFIAELFNFLILALVIFLVAKKLLKVGEKKEEKKEEVKDVKEKVKSKK